MSESPKRSVGRRKAAEKSEQKWKEAMEEEKTFEALPEVFLGTFINPVSCGRKVIPDARISITKTKNIKNCELRTLEIREDLNVSCSTNYTVIEDLILKGMVKRLACGTCLSKTLDITVAKNIFGKTEEITVYCTKCHTVSFKKNISAFTPKLPSFSDVEIKGVNFLNSKEKGENVSDENSSNVELLVCDVDVLKEDPCKGEQEQVCDVDVLKEDPCKEEQEQVCDVDIIKEDPCKGEQEQESFLQDKESEIRRKKFVNFKATVSDLSKPIRPCFFCSKMQARLSRHVKTTHATHPYVQNMLRQPKDVQAKMMRQLRSEGIFAENQRRIKAGRYDLLRIRNQGTGELSACVYCKGYYKKKLLWRHKITCIARFNKNSSEEELLKNQDTENDESKSESVNAKVNCSSENEKIPSPEDCIDNEKLPIEAPVANPDGDPPEINKIKDILYGLEHGIFSQGDENDNGLFIKQEETDYTILPDCQLGEKGQLNPVNNFENHMTVNEDQLIFDSIPSLLNNSNIPYHTNNYLPTKKKKRRGSTPENNACTDENYYYMWQDLTSSNMQCEDFLPCNTLYKPNKKRKPRSEFQYQFWKKEDEDQIINYFMDMIIAMKVPGKEACREFLNKNPGIQADWTRIKYKVYNQIQKRRKKLLKKS